MPALVPVTDYNNFYFDAIEVTKRLDCGELWEPRSLALVDRGEHMETYYVPV